MLGAPEKSFHCAANSNDERRISRRPDCAAQADEGIGERCYSDGPEETPTEVRLPATGRMPSCCSIPSARGSPVFR